MRCFKILIKGTSARESQVATFSSIQHKRKTLLKATFALSMLHLPLRTTLAFSFIFLFLKISPASSTRENKPSQYDGSHTEFRKEKHFRFSVVNFERLFLLEISLFPLILRGNFCLKTRNEFLGPGVLRTTRSTSPILYGPTLNPLNLCILAKLKVLKSNQANTTRMHQVHAVQ